jgi:hypothetical protein
MNNNKFDFDYESLSNYASNDLPSGKPPLRASRNGTRNKINNNESEATPTFSERLKGQ